MEEVPNLWKKVDPSSGDDVIQDLDPNEKVHFPVGLEPGSKLVFVKTEEIWATDPETDTASVLLSQRGFIRRPSIEEQQELLAKVEMEGILATALSAHFK